MIKFVLLLFVVYLLTVENNRRSTLPHKRAVRLKRLQEELHALLERSRVERKSYLGPAIAVSNRIKEEYPEYDWSSHTMILKRIAEPDRFYSSEPPVANRERV
jgi:hypothetical protein